MTTSDRMSDPMERLRAEIGYRMWCLDQGYMSDKDREGCDNWLLLPDSELHETDRRAKPEILELADSVIDALAAAGYRIVPIVDDSTRQEVENPSEPVAHRVVLEQFDGGWPYWRLDCLHGATDERWHVYCGECTDSDCGHRTHHDVCIVRPWWDEEGVELVADTTGPLNVPFGVDVEWDGDVPRLIPRIAKD